MNNSNEAWAAWKAILRRELDEAFNRLSPLEQDVLKLCYGIRGERRHTLEEAAEKLDLLPERVEEIEIQALDKLKPKSPSRMEELKKKRKELLGGEPSPPQYQPRAEGVSPAELAPCQRPEEWLPCGVFAVKTDEGSAREAHRQALDNCSDQDDLPDDGR
jgi:hypothetical protein